MPLPLLALIVIVVVAVVGVSAFGLALKLLWWALIGLVIGGLGRAVVPGSPDIGLGTTILGGVAASLLGGVIARALELGSFLEFLVAIIVAGVMVLYFYGRPGARRGA